MKPPQAPPLDERRAPEFSAELEERAQAWISRWGFADGERDFGRALLQIAARFSSEVAERLDGAGEKMRRGFLDWLAVGREAARPARMPVVFKLADTAQAAVLASAPVRMQADAAGTAVIFETEKDVRIVPGRLEVVVGVDTNEDAFYLPPPGLADLKPLEPLPTEWRLKSFAATGATKLQLDPQTGLLAGMFVQAGKSQYRIVQVDNGIVTVEPGLDAELEASAAIRNVDIFVPFSGARNQQEHALYLGHMDLLNIEGPATIDVVGASALVTGIQWQYWGKLGDGDETGWQDLRLAPPAEQKRPDAVILEKPKGAIEPYQIGEVKSRWIRSYAKRVDGPAPRMQADALKIRINCRPDLPACPTGNAAVEPSAEAEAMANTTPLVLDNIFFPLGREPRQFDAFYLGSQEAFSKQSANVQLCFEMSEPSFAALSCLRNGPKANEFLAGVAADGYLHLLRFDPATAQLSHYENRESLRPPSSDRSGDVVDSPPVPLDWAPAFRVPIWTIGSSIFIAVRAKSAVWIWREDISTPLTSGWESAGIVGPVSNPLAPIEGLVYLTDGRAGQLFALRDSVVFIRDLNATNPTWQPVETKTAAGAPIKLNRIAPIRVEGVDLEAGTVAEGLVGVDANRLYGIRLDIVQLVAICQRLLDDVAPDLIPAAVRSARLGDRLIAVAIGKQQPNRKILAFLSKPSTFDEDDQDDTELDALSIVGESIDVNFTSGHLTFVICAKVNLELTALVAWGPFDPDMRAVLFSTKIPANVDTPAGAPTVLPQHVIVPMTSSQVIVASFDLVRRGTFFTAIRTALITTKASEQLVQGDQVAIPVDTVWPTHHLEQLGAGLEYRGETLYELSVSSIDGEVFVYAANETQFTGVVDPAALDDLEIDAADSETDVDSILLITTDQSAKLYIVEFFDSTTRTASLDRPLDVSNPFSPPATVSYRVPKPTDASLLPLLRLDPASNGNWNAAFLERGRLVFSGAEPELQYGTAFSLAPNGRPVVVVLRNHWSVPPPSDPNTGLVDFLVDNSVGDWGIQLGNTFTNPELSWEYWNGKGWWSLNARDFTRNLKTTGRVEFEVPDDIALSDWAGKTNFWIRARLVGGDYGREKVIVKIKNVPGGSEQVVERSSEGIRAPSVLKLHISYAACKEVPPTFVLSQDSGSIRDQSDANRTDGAIVEAFVPLALTLGRLSGPPTSVEHSAADPECNCGKQNTTATVTDVMTRSPTPTSAQVRGHELYIGLAADPSEAPVNVLLLVDRETDNTALSPMRIEALVAARFAPTVADDTTRALGESGVLSLSFAFSPTRAELFGQKNLTWLRLAPKSPTDEWLPVLRGAYLNGAWASATETLTRELLGSSNGEPHLTVRLARPPVLRNSLELRVREPLGEEDRTALRESDPTTVLNDVDGLPGDWVLWQQVIDPDDHAAAERVYALDESTGEIRFGDGLHGRIPPIGPDSIVAFRYCRTEPDPTGGDSVPGNTIEARSILNLVSPVETVESVIVADQAAGGAPPESDDRVLRFGFARLRHRNRAVTARDIEDLSLQSSPDVAQAHAFVRSGYIELVVVMRGKNPQPNVAQIRELHRLLLKASPVSLSAPGALRIKGPKIRRLRVELELRVQTLDYAGTVAESVKEKLASFFDTATGGADTEGWALGMNPNEDDIAFALAEVRHLESIENVNLYESPDDGKLRLWPAALAPTDLVILAQDPIRIEFQTAEVSV